MFANGTSKNATGAKFSRTLALPTAVNEEGVKAELKDGVLTITFEKIKQEKAKKIQVL